MRTSAGACTGLLLAVSLLWAPSCRRCSIDRASSARERGAPVALDPARPVANTVGAHRILLDERTLSRIRDAARTEAPSFKAVLARCEDASVRNLRSGYQGFDWAAAVAGSSLCWHATGDARYAESAHRYLSALLDDRFEIGDGKGGETVVTHDSGYGTRTFAVYSALGYDWLRGAPGMDTAVRDRVVGRLSQWLSWYSQHGYLRDEALSNYYWGYLTALAFAGLAFAGEAPIADTWLERARRELSENVLPTFRDRLGGGGWPEGWQYGEYTTLEIALVAKALQTGAGVDVPRQMPWLAQTVTHHTHALLPDERTVYDGGTWGEHPAKASALAMTALPLALEGLDDRRAAQARWLTAHALPSLPREYAWVGLLASAPGAEQKNPRAGAATSLHLPGQGLSFVRSDWSRSAVWASFQAGPFLTPDHQDKDQGHFELWRGGDGLLVDGGDAEGSATINHNCLLIDDGGRTLNYTPNQGVWGSAVRTTRFGDDGTVAVAVGDLADAYSPKCATEGCRDRVVRELVRTFVFVRPSLLLVDDRLTLDREHDGSTWAAHLTVKPTTSAERFSAVVGSSRVDVRMLEPDDAIATAVREPTASGEGPHRKNKPWGPMWRVEVKSQRGAKERGFLAWITTDRSDAKPSVSRRVSGRGLRGAVGDVAGRTWALLFAEPRGEGQADLGGRVDTVVIVGLEPAQHYSVSLGHGANCETHVRLAKTESGLGATLGGFIRADVPPCRAR